MKPPPPLEAPPPTAPLPGEYERIIQPIEQQMMRAAWRITQHAADADDALQDAAAQIWQALPRIRAHPTPHALVLRICCNAACDAVRKRVRRKETSPLSEVPEAVATSEGAAADSLLSLERRRQVQRAIASLPEQQATAVTLRHLLDCSYDEIAHALECSVATARVHVFRGLQTLRELLCEFNPASVGKD